MPKLPSAFVAYCWEFYGPKGLYAKTFGGKLTKAELIAACRLRVATHKDFCGDTVDREAVREILIFAREHASAAGMNGQVNLFNRIAKQR